MPSYAPLVIGVTGHISLELNPDQVDRLRNTYRDEVFLPLLTGKGSTKWASPDRGKDGETDAFLAPNTPITLVSALAPGADRLIVQAALDAAKKAGRSGAIQLVAVLPMPEPDYKRTFLSSAPFEDPEFDALLKESMCVIPVPDRRGLVEEGPASDAARKLQYSLAGFCIARWSRFLVALWDEQPFDDSKPGGTAHVVEMQLTAELRDSRLAETIRELALEGDEIFGFAPEELDVLDSGPVVSLRPDPDATKPSVWFPTAGQGSRTSNGDDKRDGSQVEIYERYVIETLRRLSTFNTDCSRLSGKTSSCFDRGVKKLISRDHEPGLDPKLHPLRDACVRAGCLAQYYQSCSRWAYRAVYLLAFGAAVAFVAYAHGLEDPDQAHCGLALYALLLAFAGAVHGYVIRQGHEWKHWDYRALTEGLRVLLYWRIAGIPTPVSRRYLHRQRNELDWIRSVLDAWSLVALPRSSPSVPAQYAQAIVNIDWLGGQYRYYVEEQHKRSDAHMRLEFSGLGLLCSSLAITAYEVFAHPESRASLIMMGVSVFVAILLAWPISRRLREHLRTEPAKHRRIALNLGLGAFGVGLALFFLVFVKIPVWFAENEFLHTEDHAWAVIGMVLPAIVAALLHAYTRQRAFEDEKQKFRRMAEVYRRALLTLFDLAKLSRPTEIETGEKALKKQLAPLSALNTSNQARALLQSIGQESLIEHADWVLLHRARPIELPHAM